MKLNDKYSLGYLPAREHDKTIPAENKNLQYTQVFKQEENSHYSDTRNHGDFNGLFYWEFNSNIQDFVIVAEKPLADVPEARKMAVSQFHELTKTRNFGQRNVGSWQSTVAAVQTNLEGTTLPIMGKVSGISEDFAPKTIKFHGFLGESGVPDGNFDRDVIKVATGTKIPLGMPFIVVQTINNEANELLAFPAGNILATDTSENGLSTKVYKIDQDGKIDTDGQVASLGSMLVAIQNENGDKQLALVAANSHEDGTVGDGAVVVQDSAGNKHLGYLGAQKGGVFTAGVNTPLETRAPGTPDYQSVQNLAITTEARYYRSDEKDGKLAFSDILFPANLTGDSNVVEVLLGFDTITRTWRWFVNQEQSQQLIARVAWNMQTEDLSEGELLGLAPDSEIEPIIWIDYEKSKRTVIKTAGTDTHFIVQLVQKNITRNGETRDLYKVIREEFESPNKINFLEIVDRDTKSFAIMTPGATPWLDADNKVQTLIGSALKDNIIQVNLPAQWDLANNLADFRFLKLNSDRPVLDSIFAPISPNPLDGNVVESRIFKSHEELSQDTAIATYALRGGRDSIDGNLDSITPGAQIMPVFGSPERSIVLKNIDQEETKVIRITSYDSETGILEGENLFDTSTVFRAASILAGVPNEKPEPDQVQIGGTITIHRVPEFDNTPVGQSTSQQNIVNWIALFFLANEGISELFHIHAVGIADIPVETITNDRVTGTTISLDFNRIDLQEVQDFTVFSSGGSLVNSSIPRIFLVPQGTVLTRIHAEKLDCDNESGRDVFSLLARNVKIDGTQNALLVESVGNYAYNSICCENETDPGGGDPGDGDPGGGNPPGFFPQLVARHIRGDGRVTSKNTLNVNNQPQAPFDWSLDTGQFTFTIFHDGTFWQYQQIQTSTQQAVVLASRQTADVTNPIGGYTVTGGTASIQQKPQSQAVITVLVTSD